MKVAFALTILAAASCAFAASIKVDVNTTRRTSARAWWLPFTY